MIKSTIKGIHHTLDNHVNNINQHLFHMFQTYINTQEVNTKIQCNILKYTHNHNYHIITYFTKLSIQTSPNSITISHTHITITTMQTFNYHMTLMWLNARHVTLCMWYHLLPRLFPLRINECSSTSPISNSGLTSATSTSHVSN
jgi:hypothetical protein